MTTTTAVTIIAAVIGIYYIVGDIKRIYELKAFLKENKEE